MRMGHEGILSLSRSLGLMKLRKVVELRYSMKEDLMRLKPHKKEDKKISRISMRRKVAQSQM